MYPKIIQAVERQIRPKLNPEFDYQFLPLGKFIVWYRDLAKENSEKIRIGLERENGLLAGWTDKILPLSEETLPLTQVYVEKLIKFLLWQKGGWKIYFQGPELIYQHLKKLYSSQGQRGFDVDLMSSVYGKPFEVIMVSAGQFPEDRESHLILGGHLDGCRLGFDLGASDFKVAAVKEGQVVFSQEIPWNPQEQPDPSYHYHHLQSGLKEAETHLPKVQAIGGSAAGIYINNQVKIASLFRAVPKSIFEKKVKNLFVEMQKEWAVPFEIINDGEITALAGHLSLNRTAILGIAMGSSEAGGYLNSKGHLPGWLDELAFAPVDLNPAAAVDEWSGDRGVGAMYFSQQAVNKLATTAGFSFSGAENLPVRLRKIQGFAEKGNDRAVRVFKDLGIYLGYTIQLYSLFYDYRNLLILGRVTSGLAGELIKQEAERVLIEEFPELKEKIEIHLTDEKGRRVGQAVAAATLPEIKKS
ncbi:MAG: ROK family protein [Acidobacteriota bacterium]|nr:ROK family protein [Acidobacteriota bacterium]MDW3228558.1 ROK family protein [Acidobacteriota bacterium]MDY0230861.1 ROK family protein [Candidatus Saccharicenans sp.]